jgi:hypothetical protein
MLQWKIESHYLNYCIALWRDTGVDACIPNELNNHTFELKIEILLFQEFPYKYGGDHVAMLSKLTCMPIAFHVPLV